MRRLIATLMAACAALGPAVPAAATTPPIAVSVTLGGVPRTVPAHSRIQFTMTITQHGTDQVEIDMPDFQLWNTCLCDPDQTATISATWFDPTDNQWHVEPYDGGDSFGLPLHRTPILKAGGSLRLTVKLDLTKFRPGRYIIDGAGLTIGNVYDSAGRQVTDYRMNNTNNRLTFTMGSGASTPKPVSTPKATPKSTPRSTATPTPRPTPTSSPSPSVATSPAAALTTTDPASPAAATPVPAAAVAPAARSHLDGYLAALGIALVLAGGVLVVRLRRGRA